MNYYKIVISIVMLGSLLSCGNQQNKATQETAKPEGIKKECTYLFNTDSTSVKWTAFKTTERIGVSGTFDTLFVDGIKESKAMQEALAQATFRIPVASINSNAPDRDKKILEHFFGTMVETMVLEGQVVSIIDYSVKVEVRMNGVSDTLDFEVIPDGNKLKLSATLQLEKWNALESTNSLNKVCFDLHKGADGVSKLWPDVKLEITTVFDKTCE